MMNIKRQYKVMLVLLLVGGLILIFLSYLSLLGCDSQAGRLIQILSGLAIAVTAVIALSSADPTKGKIKSQVKVYIAPDDPHEEIYHKKELSDELQEFYKKCSDTFKSYRVQFKITNTSIFNWVNPVVTFRLPVKGQVPDRDDNPKTNTDPVYTIKKYRSNTFNTQTNVRLLEMIDGVIISNSNLPYWRMNEHITIWVRMVLDNLETNIDSVFVYIDCENADGFTETVYINPIELLKAITGSDTACVDEQIRGENKEEYPQ